MLDLKKRGVGFIINPSRTQTTGSEIGIRRKKDYPLKVAPRIFRVKRTAKKRVSLREGYAKGISKRENRLITFTRKTENHSFG